MDNKFKFTTGSADDLTTYVFSEGNIIHRFCSTCGTAIGATFPAKEFVVINTRTIDDIDLKQLKLHPVDGKSFGPGKKTEVEATT